MKKAYNYLLSWYRHYLYFSKLYLNVNLKWLLRGHIVEQIDARVATIIETVCYQNGECKECGCSVPALQMSNLPCEGDCYPKMLNRHSWKELKNLSHNKFAITYLSIGTYSWCLSEGKFKKLI